MSEKRSSEESESSRLEGLYRKATDPVLRTHLLMVWRMSLGGSVGEVAKMVGYSEKWTRETARSSVYAESRIRVSEKLTQGVEKLLCTLF